MEKNYQLIQIGNGSKLHIGVEYVTPRGIKAISLSCGSRQAGMMKRSLGAVDFSDYAENLRSCEKCLNQYSDKVAA